VHDFTHADHLAQMNAGLPSLRKNSLSPQLRPLCNKGTASAGPRKPTKSTSGFSPCKSSDWQSTPGRSFSAACSAPEAAEKLNQPRISQGLVTGHDFSHADKANQINAGL
jgi:hypothetical protein